MNRTIHTTYLVAGMLLLGLAVSAIIAAYQVDIPWATMSVIAPTWLICTGAAGIAAAKHNERMDDRR